MTRLPSHERPVALAGAAIAIALIVSATGPVAGSWAAWTRDALMVVATIVAGAGIARRAVQALLRRDVSIDVLVTLAAVGALVIGEAWEAAAVTFLFTLGHALEMRTLRRTRRALGELLSLFPDEVRVLVDGQERTVPSARVEVGDRVVVRAGERVPVDGWVVHGRAGVDESTLTGESMPVDKEPGDEVFTGTAAHGYMEIETAAVGADTTLAQVVRRVEEAQEAKPRRQLFLERFARVYTPAVVAGATTAWAVTGDAHLALTLLVIACPGALVIATPVAMVAGIGRAARSGVLFKGGEPLEQLARVRTAAFDKTGTLTLGRPTVREGVVASGRSVAFAADGAARDELPSDLREALELAARIEVGSDHPVAVAIRTAAGGLAGARADAIEAVAGGGARGRVDGQLIRVGSPAWLQSEGVDWREGQAALLGGIRDRGRTVAGVARGAELLAWFGLADEVRPHAREALAALRELGVRRLVVLTGDHRRTGAAVAAELGLDEVFAELRPEDKVDRIAEAMAAGGPVVMVGDGVNDAPALASADVGVAMGAAGTRAALETAPVALMGDDLRALPEAVRLSRATVRVVRQNLVIALGTVAVLVAGVLAGKVHMAGGMLVHQASVLAVIVNALRLAGRWPAAGPKPRATAAVAASKPVA